MFGNVTPKLFTMVFAPMAHRVRDGGWLGSVGADLFLFGSFGCGAESALAADDIAADGLVAANVAVAAA